jgi:D-proline reductase (dithiol) PrdB
MTEANSAMPGTEDATVPADPRGESAQLRPGLWRAINERYPGSMVTKSTYVPLARLSKPVNRSRLVMISSAGVHRKVDPPLDVCHPLGDFQFRRVPSSATAADLTIHHLKYPHDDADLDVNVVFPIERLRECVEDGTLGGLSPDFFTFIGYNMDPERFERTTAQEIARAAADERADVALLVPA